MKDFSLFVSIVAAIAAFAIIGGYYQPSRELVAFVAFLAWGKVSYILYRMEEAKVVNDG